MSQGIDLATEVDSPQSRTPYSCVEGIPLPETTVNRNRPNPRHNLHQKRVFHHNIRAGICEVRCDRPQQCLQGAIEFDLARTVQSVANRINVGNRLLLAQERCRTKSLHEAVLSMGSLSATFEITRRVNVASKMLFRRL